MRCIHRTKHIEMGKGSYKLFYLHCPYIGHSQWHRIKGGFQDNNIDTRAYLSKWINRNKRINSNKGASIHKVQREGVTKETTLARDNNKVGRPKGLIIGMKGNSNELKKTLLIKLNSLEKEMQYLKELEGENCLHCQRETYLQINMEKRIRPDKSLC